MPTVVGVVEGWGPNQVGYQLDSGVVVEVGPGTDAPPSTALLSVNDAVFPSGDGPGGLVLAGSDLLGTFCAATQPEVDGCFEIHGEGYIEPDRVHFSSGLVLETAPDVRRTRRLELDASWLLSFDIVCLDRAGRVTSIEQKSLGA